jgi:hypothetical protein
MHQSKRHSESWDDIAAKLRPNQQSGVKGLWATCCNASVLVQLADYAAEHGKDQGLPEELLENIRTDAFHVRTRALTALAKCVFSTSLAKPDASSTT